MKKIAFYLNNDSHRNCADIIHGNPGLGGSEYLMILLSEILSSRSNDLDIYLYTNYQGILPCNIKRVPVSSLDELAECSRVNQIDCVVINHSALRKDFISSNQDLTILVWCHNFVSFSMLDFYAKSDNVKKLICVGREQMMLYRDHSAFNKSDYIYNMVPTDTFKALQFNLTPPSKRPNAVVYIGSLIPAKGFHLLARVWKQIIKKYPDAELYVIGSGNLYGGSGKMGKYNIASAEYEKQFMPYLTDKEGNILGSVHFLGVLGNEKYDVIRKCKVGVPNPSGRTETFGLTAVEMQALGCRIVTIRCPGYLDSVFDKRYMYSNTNKLKSQLIKALNSTEDMDVDSVNCFLEDAFSYENIARTWEVLFDNIESPLLNKDRYTMKYKGYHLNFLKPILAKLKNIHSCLNIIPPIDKLLYRNFYY